MLPQEIIHGLSFDQKDPLWKAVHAILDASIDSEVASAISKDNKGEDRAWYAGRADALIAFKEILVNTRNDVLRDQGRPEEDYVS
ncbi:hypothetical protein CCP3SC1AL1_400003 [Gammaproteobacteria bacterium]